MVGLGPAAIASNLGGPVGVERGSVSSRSEVYEPPRKAVLKAPAGLLALQQAVGNQAVAHAISENRVHPGAVPRVQRITGAEDPTTGRRFFVETDPPSAVVPQGTEVKFRLRHVGRSWPMGWSIRHPDDASQGPAMAQEWDQDGERHERAHPPIQSALVEPQKLVVLNAAGRHRFSFRFKVYARDNLGRWTAGGAVVELTHDLHVSRHADWRALEESRDLSESDVEHAKSSETSDEELLQTLRRLTTRVALTRLTRDKTEAYRLRQLYRGAGGASRERVEHATTFLGQYNRLASYLYGPLHRDLGPARQRVEYAISAPRRRDVARLAELEAKADAIETAMARIATDYPEVVAARRAGTVPRASESDQDRTRTGVVQALSEVMRAIDETRGMLTTRDSRLDPLSLQLSDEIVAKIGRVNERAPAVLRRYRAQRQFEQTVVEAGSVVFEVGLLFVPGGALVSLALAGVMAGDAIAELIALRTAASAGMRGGIVSDEQARAAASAAALQSILGAVSLGQLVLGPIRTIGRGVLRRPVPRAPTARGGAAETQASAGGGRGSVRATEPASPGQEPAPGGTAPRGTTSGRAAAAEASPGRAGDLPEGPVATRAPAEISGAGRSLDEYLEALKSDPVTIGRRWDHASHPVGLPESQWEPGLPIDMPLSNGAYPTYDMARRRYWRTRARIELQERAAGTTRRVPGDSSDPMLPLTDDQLREIAQSGRAPEYPYPTRPGQTWELEHGTPQRVGTALRELGLTRSEAARLSRASDPANLMEVSPVEHAFFDFEAHGFGRARADVSGGMWEGTPAADPRVTQPLTYMADEEVIHMIEGTRGMDYSRTANTRALRDRLREAVAERGLPVEPP